MGLLAAFEDDGVPVARADAPGVVDDDAPDVEEPEGAAVVAAADAEEEEADDNVHWPLLHDIPFGQHWLPHLVN